MKTSKSGFTLMELVVVIAILGILAAIAIPKYVDMTLRAKQARDAGLLGGLRSATVLLYGSNVIADVTNGVVAGGYWPTVTQITNQMSDAAMTTNWFYYTNVTYNITNGIWTALP